MPTMTATIAQNCDQQEPQRLTPFAAAREGDCLAGERHASGAHRVEGVVFAARRRRSLCGTRSADA
jgi:hypothetical protein